MHGEVGTVAIADGQPRPMSVLVVDDNQDAAETLTVLLQMNGYSVAVTADGEAALETAALAPPDVVILDLLLPKLTGWDVARRLRERTVGKRPYFIAVTGCGQEADYQRSSEAGIDLHLLKPVDPPELLAVLERFSRRNRARQRDRPAPGHRGTAMIVTPDLAQADGIPRGPARLDQDERVAALVHDVRSPLAAIWNAVHLLSFARDEATVERVRQMVIRQLEHLSHVLNDVEARRMNGDGLEQDSEVAVVLPRTGNSDVKPIGATDSPPGCSGFQPAVSAAERLIRSRGEAPDRPTI